MAPIKMITIINGARTNGHGNDVSIARLFIPGYRVVAAVYRLANGRSSIVKINLPATDFSFFEAGAGNERDSRWRSVSNALSLRFIKIFASSTRCLPQRAHIVKRVSWLTTEMQFAGLIRVTAIVRPANEIGIDVNCFNCSQRISNNNREGGGGGGICVRYVAGFPAWWCH